MSLKAPQLSTASLAPTSLLATPSPRARSDAEKGNIPDEERSPEAVSPLKVIPGAESAADIQNSLYAILGHGNYQRLVTCSATLAVIVFLLHTLAYIIVARPVSHWCSRPDELQHLSLEVWRNVAIPIGEDGQPSQCTVYEPAIMENPDEERIVVHCHSWEYDIKHAKDSIISHWDLVCNNRWLYSLSGVVFMLGPAVIAPVAGPMSDRYGRKPIIMISAGTVLTAGFCAAASQSFALFVAARFFVAGSVSVTALMLFCLLFELNGNDWRPQHCLWATSIGTTVPLPFLELINLLVPPWEVGQAVLLLPTALLLIWCTLLEESPSWLINTSQLRRAEQVVLSAANMNGADVSKARQAFQRLKQQIKANEAGQSSTAFAVYTATSTEGALQAAVFRRRALSVAITWFTLNFVFYTHISLEMKRGGHNQAVRFVMQTLIFLGAFWLLTKRGQRETLTAVLCAVAVGSGIYTVANILEVSPLTPGLHSLVFCLCTCALALSYGYTADVFPDDIRCTGICVSFSVGRLGGLLSTLMSSFKSVSDSVIIEATVVVLLIITAVLVQFLPEVFLSRKGTKSQRPAASSPGERMEAMKATLAATPAPRKQIRCRPEHKQSKPASKPSAKGKVEPKSPTQRTPSVAAFPTLKK